MEVHFQGPFALVATDTSFATVAVLKETKHPALAHCILYYYLYIITDIIETRQGSPMGALYNISQGNLYQGITLMCHPEEDGTAEQYLIESFAFYNKTSFTPYAYL